MPSDVSPTRVGKVEGRDVFIFDNLIPQSDLAQYVQALEKSPFTRTEFARPETADTRPRIVSGVWS